MQLVVELVTGPTVEPITLDQAKKQLEIASSDSTHDTQLQMMIAEARQQLEKDTDSICCFQTWRIRYNTFMDKFKLAKSPIESITTIKYFDSANTQITWPSTEYQLHGDEIRLAYQRNIPPYADRWDAWEITYRCGYSQDGALVPAIAKRAMLLLIGYYFDANRGDNDRPNDLRTYESLVMKLMRSTYP